jgi:hypothetical protein
MKIYDLAFPCHLLVSKLDLFESFFVPLLILFVCLLARCLRCGDYDRH